MKISYNWLREYVDVKNSAIAVAQWLTMAGLEVTSLEEKPKDAVLEIEVTTNRPDWLSIIGVAREVSAITGKRLRLPKVPNILPVATRDRQIKVEIDDKPLCPRYTARVVDGVRVEPSPQWLKEHLETIGVRPINNVVDVTNFCLFELGQPMHAFDYDKLIGQTIIVRRAKKGEELITIDNTKRVLDGDMLIIADEKRPIAIAGVMGGLETEVNEGTKTILLESAYFDPISVRKTQRRLGLSTDSSYRFERGVDFEGVLFASNRAARLVAQVCNGKIGVLKEAGAKVTKTNSIKLSIDKVNRILNLELTPILVKKILMSLDLGVIGAQEELRVAVPSFRNDLRREEDLVEDIARIYGYGKIPITIPKMVGHSERKTFQRKIEEMARDLLIQEGIDEVITYSLIDKKGLGNIHFQDDGKVISIANPLSSQQEIMRPSLIPGILDVARFNINRKLEDVRIFELSKVYFRANDKGYQEELGLCILLSGTRKMGWRQKWDVDFFELKGVVENLFERLGIKNYRFGNVTADIFYPGRAAEILIDEVGVGSLGQIKNEILDNFDIKKEIFLCEIKFWELVNLVSIEKKAAPLAKFLPTKRDVSLIVEKNIYIKDLIETIRDKGGATLKDVEICDEYFGEQIPAGKRGLTFSIEYLSSDRQLTEEEIEKVHSRIRDALKNKFGAILR